MPISDELYAKMEERFLNIVVQMQYADDIIVVVSR